MSPLSENVSRLQLHFSVSLFFVTAVFASDDVNYLNEVKPVLKERCFSCHGALKHESGLRLDTVSFMRNGGESGPAIQIGNSAASLLIERVTEPDQSLRMPPEGKPLTADQIQILRKWIDEGATAPIEEHPDEDPRDHWSFQAPLRAPVPHDGMNPIDAFITFERNKRGSHPVPVVDKRLLARRIYLDLVGLPPTTKELNEFELEAIRNSNFAIPNLVDRLLDSPHYGERWGRHWMDIWRYTDWYGLGAQLRYSQKHIWHWRDWIIESLNADKGYDEIVLEMLAADEIKPTDRDALRATGFLARNYFLFNRTTWLDNTIEHTSKALLGLTMNCTKCHDHKYDPITQVDYYRMRAIFEPHQVRLDAWPGEIDLEKNGLPRVFDAKPDITTHLHVRGNEKDPDTSRSMTPSVPAFLSSENLQITPVSLPAEAHSPALQQFVLEDHLRLAEDEIKKAQTAVAQAKSQLAKSHLQSREVAKSASVSKSSTPTNRKYFIDDDFAQMMPEIWETGPGEWSFEDGQLVQRQTGRSRAYLRSRAEHPTDFQAKIKFKTTGGEMWKSVGLSFDVVDGRDKMVYLSAVSPGSKVQICYNTGAGYTYPAEGRRDRKVSLNQLYELAIAVRGTLVNVAINGEHSLAFELPVKREVGHIDLVAFDAIVEFDSLEVYELPDNVELVTASKSTSEPPTVPVAEATLAVAESSLEAAHLRPASLRSAHAADLAKHDPSKADNLSQLIREAAIASRNYELAKAKEAVARAEQKLTTAGSDSKSKAESELLATRNKLEKAQKAIDKPGKTYTSITATLKALEGPAETDESRRKAFPQVSTGRRTALARWIANRQNPLTARVAVNHIWLRHFGQPLVESVEDFGRRTKQPVHQELLDWLAVEFMENGWSMKHLHRLIVTSEVYQLSTSTSGAVEQTKQADPENEYYWRRKPVRTESQIIRDSMIHLAGMLDTKVGGPTIDPKKEGTTYRRSIYFTHSRDDQHKFLSMFDDADILRCYRRSESIVPQQALTLANSKLSLTMARKIAERLIDEQPLDDRPFASVAFELILCRAPDQNELRECIKALEELRCVLKSKNQPDIEIRSRSNLIHALLNHNDFVTIR